MVKPDMVSYKLERQAICPPRHTHTHTHTQMHEYIHTCIYKHVHNVSKWNKSSTDLTLPLKAVGNHGWEAQPSLVHSSDEICQAGTVMALCPGSGVKSLVSQSALWDKLYHPLFSSAHDSISLDAHFCPFPSTVQTYYWGWKIYPISKL